MLGAFHFHNVTCQLILFINMFVHKSYQKSNVIVKLNSDFKYRKCYEYICDVVPVFTHAYYALRISNGSPAALLT